MYKFLFNDRFFCRLAYLIFVCFILVTSIPTVAQQKNIRKSQASTNSNKRIIYGLASFYANSFQGRKTASGEIFSQSKLTCACNMLPLGTWVKITNLRNRRTVVVKVNDRLHTRMRRVADLSGSAAKKLGYISRGITRVKIEVIGKKKP